MLAKALCQLMKVSEPPLSQASQLPHLVLGCVSYFFSVFGG
ncbi:hypothetical protein C4J83_0554 [Pseudomonas sp. LBUM920]|nr:hypothetical protein C4J83_0554 [Pseudomonas sp. LBUM920]